MSEIAHKLLNLSTDNPVLSSWLIVVSFICFIVGVALMVRFTFPLKPSALSEHDNQSTLVGVHGKEAW